MSIEIQAIASLREEVRYWKERAEVAEKLADYEPSNPDTYPEYLETKEKLDKLKQLEDEFE